MYLVIYLYQTLLFAHYTSIFASLHMFSYIREGRRVGAGVGGWFFCLSVHLWPVVGDSIQFADRKNDFLKRKELSNVFFFLFLFFFLATPHGMRDLSSPTPDRTYALRSEGMQS